MKGLLALGLAVTLGGAAGASPLPTAGWVVRTALGTPDAVARLVTEAEAAGIDPLVVQVRGRGDAFYRSALVPPAEALATAPLGFDPLADTLRVRERARVLAWLNVFLVWSGEAPPKDPRHVVRARPEWGLADADGRPVAGYSAEERALGWIEGTYTDPAAPGYREHFAALAAELARAYPVDGLHLDYVRYPGPGYGHGGALGERFRQQWGLDPRWLPEELRTPDLGGWLAGTMPRADRVLATAALLWAGARAREVTALVRETRAALTAQRPGAELSAAVYPDAGPAFLEKGQDWRTWAEEGLVEALYPMAYFGGLERVEAQLAGVVELLRGAAPGVALWAGLGAYIKTPAEIAGEAAAARRLGYAGVSLFDLGSLREKPGGLSAYLGPIPDSPAGSPRAGRAPSPGDGPGARALGWLVERAAGGRMPPVPDLGAALEARWAEFEAARAGALPRVLQRLAAGPVAVPAWAELRGVYRYVHPLDPPERKRAQRAAADAARERLARGEAFAAVAREASQGGTKALGGGLGRRYLLPGSTHNDALLALQPGTLSPVLEVGNGYWVYRCDARGAATRLPLAEVPWDARRIALRRELAAELKGQP